VIDLKKLKGTKEYQGGSWLYFAPKEYEELPEEHKDQILYLDKDSKKYAHEIIGNYDVLCGDDAWGNKPFSAGCYKSVTKLNHWKDKADLKKWLYNRGIAFQESALVVPVFSTDEDTILLTTWKMVVKYVDIFIGFDNVVILDLKLHWCLYYHHDDIIHFAEGRDFNKSNINL